jgi:hypothetical protein
VLSNLLTRWLPALVAAAILGAGVYGLWDGFGMIAIPVVAICVLAAVHWRWPRFDIVAVRIVGALFIGLLALLGVNVLANAIGVRLPILVGVGFAVLVFAVAAYLYMLDAGWGQWRTGATALSMAVLLIVVAPVVVGVLSSDCAQVAEAKPVASQLDLMILTDGEATIKVPEPPPEPALDEFDVRYSVGFADGDGVHWTLVDGESASEALAAAALGNRLPSRDAVPQPRQGADSVLALLVDGTAPVTTAPGKLPGLPSRPGDVERWRHVAQAAGAAGVPTFALLQSRSKRRIHEWARFVPGGAGVSLQALESQTATDAAFRLAVSAPTSRDDLALATAYRPILLFDRSEPYPRPLSISNLFAEERVRLCHDGGIASKCDEQPILHPRELENGNTHLRLTPRPPSYYRQLASEEERELAGEAGGAAAEALPEGIPPVGTVAPGSLGAGSAIYVHPVSIRRDGKRLLYLDYWWYLPGNPVEVAGGALCGAGLVIPGITCESHESDWEGMTVVIDRSGAEPVPIAIQYAEHSDVVRYDWRQLRDRWEGNPELAGFLAKVGDASTRPLAFSASGTHATYPTPCSGHCHQTAAPALPEAPHDGSRNWAGNDAGACGESSCLQMLPTREAGREPALWNGYDGAWGEQDCRLTYYCDSDSPPRAPGQQGRYKHPDRYSGSAEPPRWQLQEAP